MNRPAPDLSGLTTADGGHQVAAAVETVRSAITALRRHPANRTGWPRTAAAAAVRAARASAALDGAPLVLDQTTEVVTDPILAGSLRAGAAIGSLTSVWQRAPMQALARLHTLAAADLVSPDVLGRPTAPGAAGGLAVLSDVVLSGRWPAPVQVALVHGGLIALRPFGPADGVVARAAARLTMITSGLDPAGLGVPEVAHLRDPTTYSALAANFATGEQSAVLSWVLEICRCLTVGAREGVSIADAAV